MAKSVCFLQWWQPWTPFWRWCSLNIICRQTQRLDYTPEQKGQYKVLTQMPIWNGCSPIHTLDVPGIPTCQTCPDNGDRQLKNILRAFRSRFETGMLDNQQVLGPSLGTISPKARTGKCGSSNTEHWIINYVRARLMIVLFGLPFTRWVTRPPSMPFFWYCTQTIRLNWPYIQLCLE